MAELGFEPRVPIPNDYLTHQQPRRRTLMQGRSPTPRGNAQGDPSTSPVKRTGQLWAGRRQEGGAGSSARADTAGDPSPGLVLHAGSPSSQLAEAQLTWGAESPVAAVGTAGRGSSAPT